MLMVLRVLLMVHLLFRCQLAGMPGGMLQCQSGSDRVVAQSWFCSCLPGLRVSTRGCELYLCGFVPLPLWRVHVEARVAQVVSNVVLLHELL